MAAKIKRKRICMKVTLQWFFTPCKFKLHVPQNTSLESFCFGYFYKAPLIFDQKIF